MDFYEGTSVGPLQRRCGAVKGPVGSSVETRLAVLDARNRGMDLEMRIGRPMEATKWVTQRSENKAGSCSPV